MRKRAIRVGLLSFFLSLSGLAVPAEVPATSCEMCHMDAEWFDEEQIRFVRSAHGAHQEVGLSCHDCHGGNPDPALGDDLSAMDPDFSPNPYLGAPSRSEVPEFCGRCHASLGFMRRFKPGARVDQVAEYWTSNHGQALRKGDEKVAICIDCHGSHEILKVTNPDAGVYPTNVATTCGRCHGDPDVMAGYTGPHGEPLPVDQVSKWRRSVHAQSMFERGDLSAPTCNDCHGNHGATPPGVTSVAFVCGQCHGREAELFRASVKMAAFEEHNELVSDGTACDTCHDELPDQIVSEVRQFSECVTCHENHAVVRPTIALLGALPSTPCSLCHEPAIDIEEREETARHYQQEVQRLVREAEKMGLSEQEQFDWLVDQAVRLETHTIRSRTGESRTMRPEFARLFEKFRIGKTTYGYEDPRTGGKVTVPVRQCVDCHNESDSKARMVVSEQLEAMKQLIGMTARAERILLAAQRGGVETRDARSALDAAVDSQIELEVLVHTFSSQGTFAEKHREGTGYAMAALVAGQESLKELGYRRGGLFVALAIILLVLLALAMKIRQMSRDDVQ